LTFSQPDVARIAAILADAARTEIMPRFKTLAASDVRHKANVFDPVTEADEAAERAISAELRAHFPGALIVGEEATAADPSLLDRLADAPLAFVVDPIDGTRNFVAGQEYHIYGIVLTRRAVRVMCPPSPWPLLAARAVATGTDHAHLRRL
jgi:fructose-1,6-bisphosphatase/inositol monophosphatase family enzyme